MGTVEKKSYRPEFSSLADPRVLRTRECLRGAMLQLLESHNLEELTIPQIAAEAGIGRSSFFRHYPSKEALLDEIAKEEIQQLVKLALSAFNYSNTAQPSLVLCEYISQHRSLWRTLLTGGAAATLKAEFIRLSQEVADSRPPQKSSWMPADAGILFVVSSTVELLGWWLRQDSPISVKKMGVILDKAIFQSLHEV